MKLYIRLNEEGFYTVYRVPINRALNLSVQEDIDPSYYRHINDLNY